MTDQDQNDTRIPAGPVTWLDEPEEHDYPSAASYLALLAGHDAVDDLIARLRTAAPTSFLAKDLLRASALPLLAPEDARVAGDLAKVAAGTPLAPVLLVRGDLASGIPLTVADGYHRLCAAYLVDEDTEVPCRMVARPRSAAGAARQ